MQKWFCWDEREKFCESSHSSLVLASLDLLVCFFAEIESSTIRIGLGHAP